MILFFHKEVFVHLILKHLTEAPLKSTNNICLLYRTIEKNIVIIICAIGLEWVVVN